MSNVGLKVGKLTVIEDLDNNKQDSKHFVKCKCECGNCIEITLREFKRGRKKSCGCLQNGSSIRTLKKTFIPKNELKQCLELGMTVKQMAEKFNTSASYISRHLKAYGLTSLGSKFFNKGERNGAKKRSAKDSISKTLEGLWENGYYSNRVDGMVGMCGFSHPNYKGTYEFRDDLSKYQDINKCSLCGTDSKKIDVHHIDENHNNWLITNLEPLCVHCHQKFHYKHYKMPYASITVESHFSSGHFLPSYDGACNRCHAHGWKYSVTIRKRINPDTGMVMDYKDLKKCLKEMEDIIDHRMLNDILPFEPTSENVAVWMWEYLSKRLLLKGIVEIKLYESENCYTTITVEDMLARCKECRSKDIFIKEIDRE